MLFFILCMILLLLIVIIFLFLKLLNNNSKEANKEVLDGVSDRIDMQKFDDEINKILNDPHLSEPEKEKLTQECTERYLNQSS